MARPTKYNTNIAEGVVELIRQGYNLRAAARANGISEASISRWRERYADFNKALTLATKEQNDKACRLSGVRPYKRKAYISPQYSPEPLIITPMVKKEQMSNQLKTWRGLPIRPRPLDYEPTDYYLNPNTERVEQIDRDGVLHSCPMWVWEQKHQPNYNPFVCEII